MAGYFLDKGDQQGDVRQRLRDQYNRMSRTGNQQQFAQQNAQQLAEQGGYFANRMPGAGQINVGTAPGQRQVNAGGGFTGGSSINFGAINAYNSNPAARAYMQSIGAVPQYSGFSVSGPNSGMTYGRTGGSNPQTINPGSNPQVSPGAMNSRNGYMGVSYSGTPTNLNAYAPTAAAPSYGAGSGGVAGGGGAAATGATPFGLSSGAASGLAGTISSGLQQEIANPSGLPVREMRAESADSIGADMERQRQALREDFGRRGQSGTAAEAAALRELETQGQADRRSDFRDISRQNAEVQLARRLQAMGLGSNFLRNEQSFDLGQFGQLLGFYGA